MHVSIHYVSAQTWGSGKKSPSLVQFQFRLKLTLKSNSCSKREHIKRDKSVLGNLALSGISWYFFNFNLGFFCALSYSDLWSHIFMVEALTVGVAVGCLLKCVYLLWQLSGLQVVLPEGSRDISVSIPFSVKQRQEVCKTRGYLFLKP